MEKIKIFKNNKFKLNEKQRMALELLVNGNMNQSEIAEMAGVSEKTLYNWRYHNEEFRNALEWYRKEIYRNLSPAAVKTIADIMLNGENDKVKLVAAQDILSRAGDDAVSKVDLESANKLDVCISVVDKVKE